MAACIAMTLKRHIFIRGCRVNGRIDGFCIGEGFIPDLYELPRAYNRNWGFKRKYTVWHPDEWIFDPISFVDGISQGDDGKVSALSRWLDYFEKGHMELDIERMIRKIHMPSC